MYTNYRTKKSRASDMWPNFVRHTVKEEDKLHDIDFIFDKMLKEESHTMNGQDR